MEGAPVILYHYTNRINWELIVKDGMIKMSPAPVHPGKMGRPVVWLTTKDVVTDAIAMGLGFDETAQRMRDFNRMDKTRIRLTVEVSRTYTHRFAEWAPKHGGHSGFLATVKSRCADYGTWRVHTKPILRTDIVDVIDVDEAKTLSVVTPMSLGFRNVRGQSARR